MAERDTSLAAIRKRAIERPDWLEQEPKDLWLAMSEAHDDVVTLLDRFGAKEDPDPELGLTPPMVLTVGDCEIFAACGDCGAPLGSVRPDGQLSTFFTNWERHAMTEHKDG